MLCMGFLSILRNILRRRMSGRIAVTMQISDYTYAHFPDKEYGEWYGYLRRDGSVAQPAKGNLFKGPFHIPRMMIKSYDLCNEILFEVTLPGFVI